MKTQTISNKNGKKNFWWIVGYITTRLVFFTWVAIWLYWWYFWLFPNMWIMKLGIIITVICFIFMGILHIIIFRLKWEIREKSIKILKRIWKLIWKSALILTLLCIFVLIIDTLYYKNRYAKIPEVDESMFYRTEHQDILPEDQDALIQLKKKDDERMRRSNASEKEIEVLEGLSYAYQNFNWTLKILLHNPYRDSKIWWERHQDECILVYSWENTICGTWGWNKDTIDRILSSYSEKITINGEQVTIREYIQANESQLKSDLEWLNNVSSMDYHLPENILGYIPNYVQEYTRGSMVALLYYIEKEDWDMVEFIVKVIYKTTDILSNLWSLVSSLISISTQSIVDNTINSSLQLLPENVRLELSQFYSDIMPDREDIIHKTIKWEYALWNFSIQRYRSDIENWFISHFPFYSDKDTKRLMNYLYQLLYNEETEKYDSLFALSKNYDLDISWLEHSIYNSFGKKIILELMPRLQSFYGRLDWDIFHKEALIKNLESGNYDIWFNEKQWNWEQAEYYYREYRLPTDEELAE